MSAVDGFIKTLNFHDMVLKMKTAGVTQEQSLRQLPFPGNCMNWNLGHLLVYREQYLGVLDGVSKPDESEFAIYGAGSEPLTDSAHALHIDDILARLFAISPKVEEALKSTSAERYAEMYNEQRNMTVQDHIRFYLQFHEAFHLGQVEILQELAKVE